MPSFLAGTQYSFFANHSHHVDRVLSQINFKGAIKMMEERDKPMGHCTKCAGFVLIFWSFSIPQNKVQASEKAFRQRDPEVSLGKLR